jgi:phage shock protein A
MASHYSANSSPFFKATLHDMADRALERSDLSVYDEYIRQAEREVEQYKRTIAPLYAQVQTSKRRRENLANQAAQTGCRH